MPITPGMRTLSIRELRHAALAALLVAAHPIGAAAQSSLTGVVTILQGSVTATRPSVPEPIPLQLRDGIFADEWIATGENAFARAALEPPDLGGACHLDARRDRRTDRGGRRS